MNLIGVDLGTRKVAVTYFEHDELFSADAYVSPESTPRAQQLRELGLVVQSIALASDATAVWIEDTIIGNNRKYSIQLSEAKGAVMAMLAGMPLDIRLVDNKIWKKEVIGNGNADKTSVRDYIDVTHSAYAPFCGDDQDLYDATCIGLYGLLVTKRAQNLQLQPG